VKNTAESYSLVTGLHQFNEITKQYVTIAFTKPVSIVRDLSSQASKFQYNQGHGKLKGGSQHDAGTALSPNF